MAVRLSAYPNILRPTNNPRIANNTMMIGTNSQGFRPLQSSSGYQMDLAPELPQMDQNQTSGGFMNTLGNIGSSTMDFLKTPGGPLIGGAATGIIGGILSNQEIKSQNAGINKSINRMQQQLDQLKKQREEAIQYRKGEASNFLTNYITARDPNRSSQIAQMYQVGQDRYRGELQNYDQMQSQFASNIAQLEAQKQREKNGWEIAGEGLLGAAQMIPFALMG